MKNLISPVDLNSLINSTNELAVIDVREEGDFGKAHVLLCANISLSHLEQKLPRVVPRKSTKIVICDGDGTLGHLAAEKVARFGYTDISLLEGGVKAWDKAGLEVFSGLNVPSKAFGEFIEHNYETPSISAEELKQMMDEKQDFIVLDSRPMEEFQVMNIPTGIDMPGAELVHRIQDAPITENTTVVVNCAGRTRSIIGAQSLINAGLGNKVVALRNGTMGWHLAGYKLEHGLDRKPPEITKPGHALALERAHSAAKHFGVKFVDAVTLDHWRNQKNERTLSILDVRTREEFDLSHIADSNHAPGGQLVQATDVFIATQNARVVLVDDLMVRALMTATWLIQLGWCEVYVLETGLENQAILSGSQLRVCFGLEKQRVKMVSPTDAHHAQLRGALLIDVSRSLSYREKHAKGATFGIRSKLENDLKNVKANDKIILIAADQDMALLTALDFKNDNIDLAVVEGGTEAWELDNLPMEAGMTNLLSEPNDVYLRAYDREDPDEVERAMNEYLTWEIGLVEQIARPGGMAFKTFPKR